MAGVYSVALVGFAEKESATFESFFRLASRRPPAYIVQDEVMDAQLLIVNADNAQALHLVRYAELPGKVMLIGQNDGGTGWPLQRKPVKLVGVLAALDGLMGVRRPASVHTPPVAPQRGADRAFAVTEPGLSAQVPLATAPRQRARSPQSEFPATRPMTRSTAAPARLPAPAASRREAEMPRHERPGVVGITDFGALDVMPTPPRTAVPSRAPASRSGVATRAPKPPVAEAPRGDVLLVAESLVEGRILHKRFKRYGLNIDWSREAAQALTLLKSHPYRLVAIDRLKGDPDAYSVCRSAKQRKLPNGQPPVVMVFAPTAGSMDRIKAGLAGCDAYLSRSVGEAEFYRVLAQHRLVVLDGFAKTNLGF